MTANKDNTKWLRIGDYELIRKEIWRHISKSVRIPVCRVYGRTQRERDLVFSAIVGGGVSVEFYESNGDRAPSSI